MIPSKGKRVALRLMGIDPSCQICAAWEPPGGNRGVNTGWCRHRSEYTIPPDAVICHRFSPLPEESGS